MVKSVSRMSLSDSTTPLWHQLTATLRSLIAQFSLLEAIDERKRPEPFQSKVLTWQYHSDRWDQGTCIHHDFLWSLSISSDDQGLNALEWSMNGCYNHRNLWSSWLTWISFLASNFVPNGFECLVRSSLEGFSPQAASSHLLELLFDRPWLIL